jgi:hypothetical protein
MRPTREPAQAPSAGLSRADVEALILVHAASPDGCSPDALARRLGLEAARAAAVLQAALAVADRGWLTVEPDRVTPTEEGNAALREARERWA